LDFAPQGPAFGVDGAGVGGLAGEIGALKGEHLGGLGSGDHHAVGVGDASRSGEELVAVVDHHHGGVNRGGGNDGQDHVGGELDPPDVVVGETNDEDVLGVAGHGEGATDVGSGGKGQQVRGGVSDLVADAEVNDDAGEDEYDGVVHDGGGADGGHGHDLAGAPPGDGVIEGVADLVEEAATLHLLEVDGGEHETEEEVQRLPDQNALSVEGGSLSRGLEDVAVDDTGHASREGDARASDGEEPVGEHEEHPPGEVHKANGDLAEGGELVGDVDVGLVELTAPGTLRDRRGVGARGPPGAASNFGAGLDGRLVVVEPVRALGGGGGGGVKDGIMVGLDGEVAALEVRGVDLRTDAGGGNESEGSECGDPLSETGRFLSGRLLGGEHGDVRERHV
jgi:hypothetical protein